MELPNRLVVPPMGFDLGEEGGIAGQAAVDYWVVRARGGWGC
jgi:2,4-dienoyl-CoA reductase-like NADH-dependent reductase (Old Yellow Enzyme family)